MAQEQKPIVDKKPAIGGFGETKGPIGNSQPKAQSSIGSVSATAPKQNGGLSSGSKPLYQPKAQPTLNKTKAHELSGSKIQPGSPKLNTPNPQTHMSQPFGVVKGPFESKKRFNKRVNETFKESGQPTLLTTQGRKEQIKINPAFNKTNEINQALENRKKIMGQGFAPKEFNKNPQALESPDIEIDEDYERSWGPKNEEEKIQRSYVDDNGKRQSIDNSGLEMFANEDGSYTLQDNAYIIDRYNTVEDLLDAGFSQEEIDRLNNDGSLYFANEDKERERASELFGTNLNGGKK